MFENTPLTEKETKEKQKEKKTEAKTTRFFYEKSKKTTSHLL